jgi:hypothetical protein
MKISRMLWFARDKERQRFYLLPGQGGSALRRKHRRFLVLSIVIGIVVSAILAGLLLMLSQQR